MTDKIYNGIQRVFVSICGFILLWLLFSFAVAVLFGLGAAVAGAVIHRQHLTKK